MSTPPLKRQSAGNDYFIEPGATPTSPPKMNATLGPDQPDDLTMERLAADAAANESRQRLLDHQAAEQREKEARQTHRANELDEREAELARREARLRALEAPQPTETADAAPEPEPPTTTSRRRPRR
jgi:hypothetical protein